MINKPFTDTEVKVETNKAVVLSGVNQLEIRSWPLKVNAFADGAIYNPDDGLPPGTVLLRVRSGGICGSDVSGFDVQPSADTKHERRIRFTSGKKGVPVLIL